MKAQCHLVTIAKQDRMPQAKGSRAHNPKQIALAAVDKGKKYPYSSERQNTRVRRAHEKSLAELVRFDMAAE